MYYIKITLLKVCLGKKHYIHKVIISQKEEEKIHSPLKSIYTQIKTSARSTKIEPQGPDSRQTLKPDL